MIADSDAMVSMEVVEINPVIDEHNRTALLGVELILSGLGKKFCSAGSAICNGEGNDAEYSVSSVNVSSSRFTAAHKTERIHETRSCKFQAGKKIP